MLRGQVVKFKKHFGLFRSSFDLLCLRKSRSLLIDFFFPLYSISIFIFLLVESERIIIYHKIAKNSDLGHESLFKIRREKGIQIQASPVKFAVF